MIADMEHVEHLLHLELVHRVSGQVLAVQEQGVEAIRRRDLEMLVHLDRVKGADLDADPAVHAQAPVNGEGVEHRHGPRPARARLAHFLVVALDVNAPIGALLHAQHARGARRRVERDRAAGAFGDILAGHFGMDAAAERPFGAMHGTIMVFLAIVPLAFAAFGNYVVPLQIGVLQAPVPSGARCFKLGKALRRAIESYPADISVAVAAPSGLITPAGWYPVNYNTAAYINNPTLDPVFSPFAQNSAAVGPTPVATA